MSRELIERIQSAIRACESDCPILKATLTDCKTEINRLTLANETLSALNVEYLGRVKVLETELWRESKALELSKQDDMDSEQEPVAWAVTRDGNRYYVDTLDYTQFIDDITNHGATYEPLYTSPQTKGDYVPMTDEERNALIGKWQDDEDWIHSKQNLSQAVEAEVVRRMKEQGLV